MTETRRVFVSGGSGFIGACLVRRLVEEGREVHLLLREGARTWRLADLLGDSRLRIHRGDIVNGGAVRDALAVARPEVLIHLAGEGAYEDQNDPRRILQTNVLGTLGLLEAGRDVGVGLFVNAGSSSEYGFKREPLRESDRVEPNSYYAVGKVAQTHLCAHFSRTHDLPLVTFRFFSVYGPWVEPTRLIPALIRRGRAGLPLEMVSAETARDFVYVDDILDAVLGFDRLPGCRGEVYNLGSGLQSNMRDVVRAVQSAVGAGSEVHWGGYPARRWDTDVWVADPTLTREMLGWSPRYTLKDGIAKMAAWMNSVGDDYGPPGG